MDTSFTPPSALAARLLFAGLAMLFLGCLILQALFLPLLAAEAAREAPEVAYLRYPILIVAILTVCCIEVVIAATAVLLVKTRRRVIFRSDALRWVTVMSAASFVASGLCVATLAYLALGPQVLPPPVMLVLVGTAVAAACVGLILVVLKSLLSAAVFLTDELAGVV